MWCSLLFAWKLGRDRGSGSTHIGSPARSPWIMMPLDGCCSVAAVTCGWERAVLVSPNPKPKKFTIIRTETQTLKPKF